MRTTLDIDDAVLRKAAELTGVKKEQTHGTVRRAVATRLPCMEKRRQALHTKSRSLATLGMTHEERAGVARLKPCPYNRRMR